MASRATRKRGSWLTVAGLQREQVYAVGPVYSITEEEDLERVAFRYGVATADLLWWNPDLADSAAQAQQ